MRDGKDTWHALRRALNPHYLWNAISSRADCVRVGRGLARVRHVETWDSSDFLSVRNELHCRIVRHAGKCIPYYRRMFERHGVVSDQIDTFSRLPLLDKSAIRQYRSELVAQNLEQLPHSTMNTGGSTGEPLEFLTSGGCIDRVHQRHLWSMMGFVPGDRIVTLDGTPLCPEEVSAGRYWKAKPYWEYGHFALSALYLNDESVEHFARQMDELRPAFVRGYPSAVYSIARYVRERASMRSRLKGVMLTSEAAMPTQVAEIENAFNAPVTLQYGHSEAAVFAYAAPPRRQYLCSPFYGFTEVVDAEGKGVPVGETGEIVVSGFFGWPMPLLRYRTGDLGVYGGEVNGVVRLNEIVGRTQDVLYRPDGNPVLLTALIFGRHYHAFAHIRSWQLVQAHPGEATVRVVRDRGYSIEDEMEIARNFHEIAGIVVRFEYPDAIARTARGKSQFVVHE